MMSIKLIFDTSEDFQAVMEDLSNRIKSISLTKIDDYRVMCVALVATKHANVRILENLALNMPPITPEKECDKTALHWKINITERMENYILLLRGTLGYATDIPQLTDREAAHLALTYLDGLGDIKLKRYFQLSLFRLRDCSP